MIEKDLSSVSDVLSDGELLAPDGKLAESGYAFSQVKRYSRSSVKKRRSNIKERDCYYFGDDRHAVSLSIARYAHSAVATVTVLDFVHIDMAVKHKTIAGRGVQMPDSIGDGRAAFDSIGLKVSFTVEGGKRKLRCECKDIGGGKNFECEIILDAENGGNITTATPLVGNGEFLYGTRVNCLNGTGWYVLGNERVEFAPNARGELEWSRGVYPLKCVWYRAGLSTDIDGMAFGLSLARFGVKARVNENALFCNGQCGKLKDAKFEIPFTLGEPDYLKPWKIYDDEERVSLTFYPMIETEEKIGTFGLSAKRHKVYGKFYGKATLDDGTLVDIADRIGYAEHMVKRW